MANRNGQSQSDPTLVHVANSALRHWRAVLAVPLLLAALVGAWSVAQKRQYAATTSFLPQSSEGRAVGGAAALAQQFGVGLGLDRPGQSPQYYLDLLNSLSLLRRVVETEHPVQQDGRAVTRTLIEWLEVKPKRHMPLWRVAAERFRERHLSVSVGRETGVVGVRVTAPHPALAEAVAARMLELLGEFNITARQARAGDEGRFIGERVAEAHAQLLAVERQLQDFLAQNRMFDVSSELRFEHDRLQRQVIMRQEIYASLLQSQEQARIDAIRDTPVFSIIDHPAGTAKRLGRGVVPRTLIAFTLGLILALTGAFFGAVVRRHREQEELPYQELEGLARQAWDDLRRPDRWLRTRAPRHPAG